MRVKETVRAKERERKRVTEKSQSERSSLAEGGESYLQSKKILDGVLLDAKNARPSMVSDRSGIFLHSHSIQWMVSFKKDGRIDRLGVQCLCVSWNERCL